MAITDITLNQSLLAERQMRLSAKRIYENAINQYESALRNFWQNPNLTPQQMSDCLGTDAVDYFTFYNKLRLYILEINPAATLTPVSNYGTFTANQDGTVTINSVN